MAYAEHETSYGDTPAKWLKTPDHKNPDTAEKRKTHPDGNIAHNQAFHSQIFLFISDLKLSKLIYNAFI